MAVNIRISLNPGLYLKDPQESDLGRRIIKHSILLLEELGFEQFNFKKLAEAMGSTEASIYRYFENKHFAYTRDSFLTVQASKHTPKINKKLSQNRSKTQSIFLLTFEPTFH